MLWNNQLFRKINYYLYGNLASSAIFKILKTFYKNLPFFYSKKMH